MEVNFVWALFRMLILLISGNIVSEMTVVCQSIAMYAAVL